ncbi:unnamed protein product [Toxocara canis]|uniref:Uncharacterized protein n=1 Tax=Toxocara canis TaxID=6265 RepID=A0A183UIY7_TOXCA|nr:unnamed protein product [Toxocara canis]
MAGFDGVEGLQEERAELRSGVVRCKMCAHILLISARCSLPRAVPSGVSVHLKMSPIGPHVMPTRRRSHIGFFR